MIPVTKLDEELNNLLNQEIYKNCFANDEEAKSNLKDLAKTHLKVIAEHTHYLNIFEMTGRETAQEFEMQILEALAKPHDDDNNIKYILDNTLLENYKIRISLSITCNFPEKTKKDLEKLVALKNLKVNEPWVNKTKDVLEYLFKQALLTNKPELAEFIIQNDLVIEDFLSKEILIDLYNNEYVKN